MTIKANPPNLDDHSRREARLKPLLLSLAFVLVVSNGVALGYLDDPFLFLTGIASSRLWMAALAACLVMGAAGLVLYLRQRSTRSHDQAVTERADPLASLANRALLLSRLDEMLASHATQGRQLALHVFDIDRFSQVNAAGFDDGDALLSAIAEKLLALTGDPQCVGRIGDDEFAVIQPETGGARHAEIFVRRVQDAVREAFSLAGRGFSLDASIGVAVAPEQGESAAKLLRSASLAMNTVKEAGGGSFRIYSRHLDLATDGRRHLEQAVAEAVQNGWFELHFQPQYDLSSRRLVGFEALARLNHPELGMLMPNDFLPAACGTGVMPVLGEWVLEQACRVAVNWPEHLKLAVNACLEEVRSSEYADTLVRILRATGFELTRLQLEVPELTLAKASPEALNQVHALTGMGVTVLVDDFGVSNSNLQALARSGCRAVKVDRSFVKGIGKFPETDAIVRGLIATAKAFNLEVMAEGIERAEQAQFLLGNGCHVVQGYLFGRPAELSEIGVVIAKDLRNATARSAAIPDGIDAQAADRVA